MADNLKLVTPQRKWTMVYNDFLESNLLSPTEKIIFITIKKFADNESLTAFPSINTIANYTGLSRRGVIKSLKSMAEKGVIKIEKRESSERGHENNLYTLYDYPEMWVTNEEYDVKDIVKKAEEAEMIRRLQAAGYTVTKEKEPSSDGNQNQTQEFNNINYSHNIGTNFESQGYSIDFIRDTYGYEGIIEENKKLNIADIDAVINVLYEALNTTKPTIRIAKENKPAQIVKDKLLKLSSEGIVYALNKYSEQTDRIEQPLSYMLTILYTAEEQMQLDLKNEVMNDMAKHGEL